MKRFASGLAKSLASVVALSAAGLLAYDLVAIRPHLPQIEQLLARAPAQDAAPPELIRRLIDAEHGSPTPYAVSVLLARLHPQPSRPIWLQIRRGLWQVLLPLRLGKTRMYGLYATLTFNGIDNGLSAFAQREYARTLAELTLPQAAATVAMTHAPGYYRNKGARLEERAQRLLTRAAIATESTGAE